MKGRRMDHQVQGRKEKGMWPLDVEIMGSKVIRARTK
jgi:hypothetical protein